MRNSYSALGRWLGPGLAIAATACMGIALTACGWLLGIKKMPDPHECCHASVADDPSYYVGATARQWAWHRLSPSPRGPRDDGIERVRYGTIANRRLLDSEIRGFVETHPGATAKDYLVASGMRCVARRGEPGAFDCEGRLPAVVFCVSLVERPEQLVEKHPATYVALLMVSGADVVGSEGKFAFGGRSTPCRW